MLFLFDANFNLFRNKPLGVLTIKISFIISFGYYGNLWNEAIPQKATTSKHSYKDIIYPKEYY